MGFSTTPTNHCKTVRILKVNGIHVDDIKMYCDFCVWDNPYFNDTHCCNFLTTVSSNNGYNDDTEAPDEYDLYIASVVNPEEQAQLRWVSHTPKWSMG